MLLILLFSSYIGAEKNDAHYYYNLGVSRTFNGDFDLAVSSFLMALKKEKNNPEINADLAAACLKYIGKIDFQQKNFSKIKIYLNMAEAAIKMTDQNIMNYYQGEKIILFNSPHQKVIKEIKEKLIKLKQQLSNYKNKFNKSKEEKSHITNKASVSKIEKEIAQGKIEHQPVLIKPSEKKAQDDNTMIQALLNKNKKLLEEINKNKQEIKTLKNKLLFLENEYTHEAGKTNK